MQKQFVKIINNEGLHTRPATHFVKCAKKFSSEIIVEKKDEEGKVADGKSLVKLLKIGISQGDSIILKINGDDEIEAMEELLDFLEGLSG